MILLQNVMVNKYKSIQEKQNVNIESDVTTLVGMNEAGKTAFLEAMAKFNYFEDDDNFKFNSTLDYPRKELKKYQRANEKIKVVECTYKITDELMGKIDEDLGENVFNNSSFTVSLYYDETTKTIGNVHADSKRYIQNLAEEYEIEDEEVEEISKLNTLGEIKSLISEDSSENLQRLVNYLDEKLFVGYTTSWKDPLSNYVYRIWLSPNIPKFWYYDEYFSLQSRINLNQLNEGKVNDESSKTAKALLEVSQIDLTDLLSASDFESFIAELEATSNEITDQMFHYWTANNNLEIEFKIDSLQTEKILDIRVKNQKHRVSIPLNQRSKGFNWFFSFIVWFSKIKSDNDSNYILLLDEPGLNLHASAQGDLLKFIEDLSGNYQVIYTTHSPFMVDSTKLDRVRTVFEGDEGTTISDSIQEKDSKTLFPLQAALGYEIAQNLFVAKNNLLVEGPADLIYLTKMSELLNNWGKEGLRDDIVLVPVGGLDKIPSFISLMTGNNLSMVALLDSFNSPKGKQKLDDLVIRKIIKDKNIRFFDEFICNKEKADIEDLFSIGEYLKYFKAAFPNESIQVKDVSNKKGQILPQINQIIGRNRFNHYLPAKEFLKMNLSKSSFSKTTIENFESLFETVNKLFK